MNCSGRACLEVMDGGQVGIGEISAPSFTDDLWLEIFSRLPIKPLFRFRCVSKAWRSLLVDYCNQTRVLESVTAVFCQLSVIDQNHNLKCIDYKYVCASNEKLSVKNKESRSLSIDLSLDFLPIFPHFDIVHGHCGLLLCLSVKSYGSVYYVCNPLLKTWVVLPALSTVDEIADTVARLSVDPNTGHFRVILCVRDIYREPGRIVLRIFSSDTGNWVQTKVVHGSNRTFWPYNGYPVFHSEALYFLLFPFHVMRVDILKGDHGLIELPIREPVPSEGILYECEGRLYYIRGHEYYHLDPHGFQVWLLKDWNSNKWIMKHDICSKTLCEKISEVDSSCPRAVKECLQPLAFAADLNVIFLKEHCNIHYCDLSILELENVCRITCSTNHLYRWVPFCFSPSLSLLGDTHGQLQYLEN